MTLRHRFSAGVSIPAAALITFAMVGCAGDAGENTSPTPSASFSASVGSPAPINDPAAVTPIIIELDGIEIAGELDSSPASASLLAQLPLTMTLRDYGGQELIGELPEPLDLEGAPEGSDAPALTIGYYVPQQSLVLYYESVGYFGGIVPIGTFEATDAIEGRTGELTVALRRR